jgi:hypothetical protein
MVFVGAFRGEAGVRDLRGVFLARPALRLLFGVATVALA